MIRLNQVNKIPTPSSGFTLIEILLVMLLISILVLGINAAYRQAHVFWSRITKTQPIYAQSRTALDTLRQELSSVYLPQAQQDKEGEQPPALFSVKSGNEISFLTLNPAWNSNPVISRPAKITYRFQMSEETGILTRSEQLYSGEKAIGIKGPKQTVLSGLDSLIFQVLDRNSENNEWKDNIESTEKPPQAIRIQLRWIDEAPHGDRIFEMIIPILCSEVLSNTTE